MNIVLNEISEKVNQIAYQIAHGKCDYPKELEMELADALSKLSSDELDRYIWEIVPFLTKHENRYELYKPLPFSYEYHHSEAKNRWMFGGNRTSKTFGSMVDVLFQFTSFIPKSMQGNDSRDGKPKVPLFRYSSPKNIRWLGASRKEGLLGLAIPMFFNICPDHMWREWSAMGMRAISNSGSTLQFQAYTMFTESMAGVKMERIHYDEEPTQDAFTENEKRILQGGEITGSMTPEKGITYIYDAVVKRAMRSFESVPKNEGRPDNPHRQFGVKFDPLRKMQIRINNLNNAVYKTETFHPTLYDNIHIKLENITDILLKFEHDKRKQEIAVLGEFTSSSGRVFSVFDKGKHVVPNHPPVFDEQGKEIPGHGYWCANNLDPDFPRFVMIDCHTETAFHCCMICCIPGNIKIIERELIVPAADPDLFAKIVDWENEPMMWKNDVRKRWLVWRIGDPIGNSKRILDGKSTFDLFREYLVKYKDVKHIDCLTIRAWKGGQGSGDVNAMAILYVRNALMPPRQNLTDPEPRPRLYVDESCSNHIFEFEHWMFNPVTKQWLARHSPETNKTQDKNNHHMQCVMASYLEPGCRYMVRETPSEINRSLESLLRSP